MTTTTKTRRKKPPATHAQIDAMNVTQLRAVLPLLGAPKPDRKMLKPALVTWAHEYLTLGWPEVEHVEEDAAEPVKLEVKSGALPEGLALSADGELRGEPEPLDVTAKLAAAEEAGTDLEVLPSDVMPTPSRWQQILDVAATVARANVTPSALRGKPADCAVVLLAANDLGIPITQALQKLAVVDGKLVMMAELMVALIRRDGHTLSVDPTSDHTGATVHGRRVDTGEVMAMSFTLEDALTADLIQRIDPETGRAVARSKEGNPLAWQKYTTDMLYNRAVSRLARRLFPDVLGGVSYIPEELGATDDFDDAGAAFGSPAAQHEEATVSIERQRHDLHARIVELPEDVAAALKAEWTRRNLPNWSKLTAGGLRTATRLVEDAEASVPDDVELVDDQGKALDQQADAAVERDDIEEAQVVPEVPEGDEHADPSSMAMTAADAPVQNATICHACDRPIAPGPADDGTGEMVEQPVKSNGHDWHATCAPM